MSGVERREAKWSRERPDARWSADWSESVDEDQIGVG